jgi:hypothetical protein
MRRRASVCPVAAWVSLQIVDGVIAILLVIIVALLVGAVGLALYGVTGSVPGVRKARPRADRGKWDSRAPSGG